MVDYPDWTKPYYSRKEFASLQGEQAFFTVYSTSPLSSGSTASQTIFTIPSGRRFYLCKTLGSAEFKNRTSWIVSVIGEIFKGWSNGYKILDITWSPPATYDAGVSLSAEIENKDTIDGHWYIYVGGFLTPASKPEPVKSNDPVERLIKFDFNYATILHLSNQESVFLIHKRKDKKTGYVRLHNYGKPNQRKLSSFYISHNEVLECINTVKYQSDKLEKVLDKYEKKYKPKRWFRII